MYLFFLLILVIILFFISNQNNYNTFLNQKNDIINKLVRQSARWSIASSQDESPFIAVLHANYGAGYLWAIKEFASNEEIYRATGIDVFKFENEIVKNQDKATLKMINACPKYAPYDGYLKNIAMK